MIKTKYKSTCHTNRSNDSDEASDEKNNNGLTLDDKDSETNFTSTRTDDFTASIEGSTIDMKDYLEFMKEGHSF